MRSLLLILATILLLGGGVVLYVWMQPSVSPQAKRGRALSSTAPATQPQQGKVIVGTGYDGWVEHYDSNFRLASRFRADKYDPQPDRTVKVDRPLAEFLLGDGDVIRIEGKSGDVQFPAGAGETADALAQVTRNQPPNFGHLYDVVISLFESQQHAARDEPLLTVEMNNAVFDNDTYRISTEAFEDAAGNRIEGDQVPVTVRGRDYDFDGRGLIIRWNELDRQLQLLEIAHGGELVIRNAALPAQAAKAHASSPMMLAAADDRAVAEVLPPAVSPGATTQPPRRSIDDTVYRATLEQDVRIIREGKPVISGDAAAIDFQLATETEPATQPTTRDSRKMTHPASAPTDSPTIIRWTGKLRITPLDSQPIAPMAPGQAVVQMTGSPVTMDHQGTTATAALLYNSADASVILSSSDTVSLVSLLISDGTTVKTREIQYSPQENLAILRGASEATIKPKSKDGEPGEPVHTSWSNMCMLRLKGEGEDRSIERADIEGDVAIVHPRLDMDAQKLGLSFVEELREVQASGDVKCKLRGGDNQVQSIAAQDLLLKTETTADGDIYPSVIQADGDVAMADDQEKLEAQHVLATFVPVAQPSESDGFAIELNSLLARQDVKFTGRDGAGGVGSVLKLEKNGDRTEIELDGEPFASLTDGQSTLSGRPSIRFIPEMGFGEVLGSGTLHAAEDQNDSRPPFDVAWKGSAKFDGDGNRVDFHEDIVFTMLQPDGPFHTANTEHLHLILMDPPATVPTTVQASEDRPTALGMSSKQLDLLTKKQAKLIMMSGDVRLESAVKDENGEIQRRVFITAPKAQYDFSAQRMQIAAAGRMLFEDHQKKSDAGAKPDQPQLGPSRGTTAFEWKKSLTYDAADHLATMLGDVVVHHKPDEGEQAFRLYTDSVLAELQAKEDGAKSGDPADTLELKKLIAAGGARVESETLRFEARSLEYDAARHLFIAHGSDDDPITVFDEHGGSEGLISELRWNTKTNQIELKKFRAQVRY